MMFSPGQKTPKALQDLRGGSLQLLLQLPGNARNSFAAFAAFFTAFAAFEHSFCSFLQITKYFGLSWLMHQTGPKPFTQLEDLRIGPIAYSQYGS